MRRALPLLASAALVAAGAGVAPDAGAGPAKPKGATVTIADDAYSPAKLTVRAGTRVTWRWKGVTLTGHDVVVDSGPESFSSPTQFGGTYRRTMKKPGTYRLYCTEHDDMRMQVVVRRARR